jgi:transposase
VRTDGNGQPINFVLQPGHRHESLVFEALLRGGRVRRHRGPPRWRPHRVCADKGYSSGHIRRWLRQHHMRLTIPRRRDERRRGRFDQQIYRQRARVEQFINRLKQMRRVATRYEKRAANYLAMVTLAAIRLWL